MRASAETHSIQSANIPKNLRKIHIFLLKYHCPCTKRTKMPKLGTQHSFLPPIALQHGGDTRKGKRKIARPIDPKRPLHLTLKSSRAQGAWSLLHPKHCRGLELKSRSIAQRHDVAVYRFVNVGNHLHLLVKARNRRSFQGFLRELSGALAMMVTGAKKGKPAGRFWDSTAWSRVVNWGRDFRGALNYLIKNIFEALGYYGAAEKRKGLRIITLEFDRPPPGLA
jgi:REP element-mobilizing transposase RayT